MQIDLTQIIIAIFTLLFGLLVKYVIPNIKSKTDANKMEIIRAAVKSGVYAVEQLYKSRPGQEKKQMVLDYLREQGFNLDDELVEKQANYLIESVVKELNLEQGEHTSIG